VLRQTRRRWHSWHTTRVSEPRLFPRRKWHGCCEGACVRPSLASRLPLPLALLLAACGSVAQSPLVQNQPVDQPRPTQPSEDAGADSGACPAGYYVEPESLGCVDGQLRPGCCPNGANCSPPSNTYCDLGGGACSPEPCAEDAGAAPEDAGAAPEDAAAVDSGACPAGQVLLEPCCGGDNDSSCSNGGGPPAPAPFCVELSSLNCFMEGDASVCMKGGCEGELDTANHTLGCNCI